MVTQDTPTIMASIISISLSVYFVFCFLYGAFTRTDSKNNTFVLEDNFDLGYIRRVEPQPVRQKVTVESVKIKDLQQKLDKLEKRVKHLNKVKQAPKQQKVETLDPLTQDCIAALIALGHKKFEASRIVEDYCKTNKIESVEKFIANYFSRKK